jgi:hypothetical protein
MTKWRDVIDPSSEFTKNVLRDLAAKGYEMTPEELIQEQKIIIEKLRECMRSKGHVPPESDQEMFDLIMRAAK